MSAIERNRDFCGFNYKKDERMDEKGGIKVSRRGFMITTAGTAAVAATLFDATAGARGSVSLTGSNLHQLTSTKDRTI